MAVITPTQFREHYPQLQGFAQDTLVSTYIDRADALDAAWCGLPKTTTGVHTFASATYDLRFNGPSTDPTVLCLCVSPLISVSSLTVDARAVTPTTLVLGTDYDLDLLNGRIGLLPGGALSRWPSSWQGIRVQFTAGYAVTPPDLVVIIATQVRHLWVRRRVQDQDAAMDFGPATTLEDLDQLIPAAVLQTLEPYRVCAA